MENKAKPWLASPREGFIREVKNFYNYLESCLDRMSEDDIREVKNHMAQLNEWCFLANLLVERCLNGNCSHSILEELEIPKLEPRFCRTRVAGTNQLYQVLVNPQTQIGFICLKLLGRVEMSIEKRDIWLACRCVFDENEVVPTGENYVLKMVAKVNSKQVSKADEILRREFKAQYILSKLKHPNISCLHSYYEDDRGIYAVSEYAGASNVMELLSAHALSYRCGFAEREVKNLLFHAVNGLLAAHSIGIAHRDVSLENMVVSDRNDLSNTSLQLIDWGHCIALPLKCSETGMYHQAPMNGPVGKVKYMGPELFSALLEYDPFAADVFSLGVCLFALLTGQMPFQVCEDYRGKALSKSATQLLDQIGFLSSLSEPAVDLLNGMLAWSPEKRLNLREVLHHPFMSV